MQARGAKIYIVDPRFTETGVRELLEQSGGQHITIVHED
jgi:hypothetical protein